MNTENEQPRSDLEAEQVAARAEQVAQETDELEHFLRFTPPSPLAESDPEIPSLSGEDVDDSPAFLLTESVMGFEKGTLLEAMEAGPVSDTVSFRIVFAEDLQAAGADDEGLVEDVAPLGWYFLHNEVRPLTSAARELHDIWAAAIKKKGA